MNTTIARLILPLVIVLACVSLGQENKGKPDSAVRFDGPAELPRVYMSTNLADTPAPGTVRLVKSGDNLQGVLDEAKCGDTVALQSGATFRGLFHFPAKHCDDAHWIIVRSSASNADLPDEYTRISPCFAGVASLPSRPDFACSSPKKVMAAIEYEGKPASGPIALSPGANHYRFIGLEITRAMPGIKMRDLAAVEKDETADHIIFDRVWMHGTAQDETKAGAHLSGITYAAVINSFINDLHCIAKDGACIDAQAVNGGTGQHPGGPYKIVNNYLEASGENIMFGGGGGTTTPADIEIRHNYLFKPLAWKPGEPGFMGSASGQPFIVKNHFELKNAQRVLFEGNILENCWGGFSQAGFSILLTPKDNGHCPVCRVSDVTIRYDRIAHVASGFQISNGLSGPGVASQGGERYSIHDVVLDDIDGPKYKGFGLFAIIGSVSPQLRGLSIQHVTAFPPRGFAALHVPAEAPKIADVKITDNIFMAGERQITSTGGGEKNCAFRPDMRGPAGVLSTCFANLVFTKNLIINGRGGWPNGNIEVSSPGAAGVYKVRGEYGDEYRLCHRAGEAPSCNKPSPGIRAGTDGKDLGADIEAVEAAISGRE